jgi:hypothetical protein
MRSAFFALAFTFAIVVVLPLCSAPVDTDALDRNQPTEVKAALGDESVGLIPIVFSARDTSNKDSDDDIQNCGSCWV